MSYSDMAPMFRDDRINRRRPVPDVPHVIFRPQSVVPVCAYEVDTFCELVWTRKTASLDPAFTTSPIAEE